ncbi:MAG: glycosyltransferase [Rhodospirillales bacterium]|nr:glycosyltransferase [Rhodospirillales bacterium]
MPPSPARPTIALLLPTMNEVDGLRHTLDQLDPSLVDDILVVDAGSTDGTVEYALDKGLSVVTQLRKGLAEGVFDAVSRLDADYVIEFSPDGNCLVEHLSALVAKLREGYDCVVVSRYLPPARSDDDTLITAFGNWMFSRMIRGLGRFPVTDSLNIYRGFRRDIVFKYDFERLMVGPVFEPLVSAISNLHGLRISEIPGDEPRRVGGASKMRVVYNGSCILLMIVRCYLRKIGLRV